VRTLAADLGRLLGGGAHLRNLRRTRAGSFTVDEAASVDDAELLPAVEAMRDYPAVEVDAATARLVANGRPLPRDRFTGGGPSSTRVPCWRCTRRTATPR
jgi:tRNA pseudouridine55 synthase